MTALVRMRGFWSLVLLALLQSAVSFTVRPLAVYKLAKTARFSEEPNDAAEPALDGESVSQLPSPTPSSTPPPQKQAQRLDPLIASLTRNDAAPTGKTQNVPFFGEVEVDGSLIVLVPAIVIGVLGFVMSIGVAMNSKDAFVDQMVQLSDGINNMAIQKASTVVDPNSCRGLCSAQDQDLENLRGFMEGLRKP
jgi:hypothetical protein